jgi:polyisoprenoid-binding protein YceI
MNRSLFIGATASAAVLAGTLPARADLVWTPDVVHSRAEFLVSHLVVSKVWGHIPFLSLELATEPSGMPTRVHAVLNPAHLDTDNHDRDADLRSPAFFDIAQYPTITFESTSFSPAGKSPDGLVAYTCAGNLTIKGITKAVSLAGTIAGRVPDGANTERIGYSAATTIDRRDFGLDDARMSPGGIPIVGNAVQITLTMEATRAKG